MFSTPRRHSRALNQHPPPWDSLHARWACTASSPSARWHHRQPGTQHVTGHAHIPGAPSSLPATSQHAHSQAWTCGARTGASDLSAQDAAGADLAAQQSLAENRTIVVRHPVGNVMRRRDVDWAGQCKTGNRQNPVREGAKAAPRSANKPLPSSWKTPISSQFFRRKSIRYGDPSGISIGANVR
jgi:hypothetical protein